MTTIRATHEFGTLIDAIEFQIPDDVLAKYPPKQYTPRKVSASGIKRCSREWYYTLSATTRSFAREQRRPEWDLAAVHGSLIHEQIQEALLAYDVIRLPEAYLPKSADFISGRIDGELTGRRALLEIKSMGQKHWATLPDNDKFRSYQDQIQTYLAKLDLPEALLVCVRREPIIAKPRPEDRRRLRQSLVKEFSITRDPAEGERLIAKANRIREHVERQVVPPAEPSDACFFCAYQHLCAMQDLEDALAEAEATDGADV